jgi:predicted ATPase
VDSIRLLNLRSLVDTGEIPIKPLTLLVGANSSGKSSFLRVFPLLRQSIDTPTDSPILWFGRYVDFGSIDEAINLHSEEKALSFEFSFTLSPPPASGLEDYFWVLEPTPVRVRMSLVSQKRFGSRVRAYDLSVGADRVRLAFAENGSIDKFTVNSFDATERVAEWRTRGTAYILPTVAPAQVISPVTRGVVYQPYLSSSAAFRQWRFRSRHDYLLDPLINELRHLFHGNAKPETIRNAAARLRIGTPSSMLALMPKLEGGQYWEESVSKLSVDGPRMRRIADRVLANAVPDLLVAADEAIARFAASVTYMGPLRATAQRYYRAQDLAVREVDFQGENLAMFLRSLSEREQKHFASFSREYFGFTAESKLESGHVALIIKQSESPSTRINLADMGFGYSQVLPVVAQLWSTFGRTAERSTPRMAVMAIEQPELHLHPAYQTTLANVFVGAVKAAAAARRDLRLVVETHSEVIVNRIGRLVQEEAIPAKDVQIVIFDHDRAANRTSIRIASYGGDGALKDWPFGFFAPEID